MRLFVLFVVCAAVFGGIKEADAWVEGYQPFPEGEATVLVHRFCWASNCDYSSDIPQWHWEAAIDNAARAWSNAGSNFRFSFESFSADANHDPCQPRDGYVYVILADPGPLCPGDTDLPPAGVGGRMHGGPGWARIYIRSNLGGGEPHFRRLLLHEFGHVVGLGHPDEHGQYERAIMNSHLGFGIDPNWAPFDELQPDDITGILNLYGAKGVLENPRPSSYQSGLGVISGWVCEAGAGGVGVYIDNQVVYPAADGTERLDTQDVCGDTDNGFGLLFNWNRLGDGEHTVVALASGVEIGRATFTVTTLGEEFLRDATGRYVLEDFPTPGQSVTVEWEQSLQNFVITDIE